MRIVAVLQTRSPMSVYARSSEYDPIHAQALAKQVAQFAPFAEFQVLSDVRTIKGVDTIPLKHNWPGWWSKMELFSPEMKGDILYIDLDTVLVGKLDDIENVQRLTLLRDFYRDGTKYKEGLGSGLMFLPEADRARVWDHWMTNPSLHMRAYVRGDQHLLEHFYLNDAQRWQDVVPGQVVSWKVHCRDGIPPEARVVCFHGLPRPWHVARFAPLYTYRG